MRSLRADRGDALRELEPPIALAARTAGREVGLERAPLAVFEVAQKARVHEPLRRTADTLRAHVMLHIERNAAIAAALSTALGTFRRYSVRYPDRCMCSRKRVRILDSVVRTCERVSESCLPASSAERPSSKRQRKTPASRASRDDLK